MLRCLSVRRRNVVSFVLACLLLLSASSPVLAISDAKLSKTRNFNLSTILQQNQQLPITRYLALGDSLAYGFQPNDDHTHGYVDDLSAALQSQGITSYINLGCPRETTSTFIVGGQCSDPSKSQLAMARAYLQQPPTGQATLVTLDIGANDVLDHVHINIQNKTCIVDMNAFNIDLQTLDQNLTQSILPQLHDVLIGGNGQSTGNLALLNYYNPFQNICPNMLSLTQIINTHLAQDIEGLGTLVDIFGAFGGSTTPNLNLCNYTWMCSAPPLGPDIHPTTAGYQVMASAIENQNLFQVKRDGVNGQSIFQVQSSSIDILGLLSLFNGSLYCKDNEGCKESGND